MAWMLFRGRAEPRRAAPQRLQVNFEPAEAVRVPLQRGAAEFRASDAHSCYARVLGPAEFVMHVANAPGCRLVAV